LEIFGHAKAVSSLRFATAVQKSFGRLDGSIDAAGRVFAILPAGSLASCSFLLKLGFSSRRLLWGKAKRANLLGSPVF